MRTDYVENDYLFQDGIKIVSNSFDFQEPSVRIIHPGQLCKEASSSTQEYLKNIKSEPGRTKLLALFLGAGEYYSSNRNGDFFAEADLKKTYRTFMEYGHVYENHQNKDPAKKKGDIEFATYNTTMHRVEGIMSLINDRCKHILPKIDAGEDIAVSMAAKLKFDKCSICGHESKTFSEYCSHLKNEMNKIYPDGRKVYAINPDPVFFDQSIVFKPADRCAYVLKKVANDLKISEKYFDNPKIKYIKESSINKKALLTKLSDLEKKLEGFLAGKVEDGVVVNTLKRISDVKEMDDDTIKKLKDNFDSEDVFSTCTAKKMLLTLKEFLKLLGHDEYEDSVSNFLPGGFSKLLSSIDEEDDIDFGRNGSNSMIESIIKRILPERSLDDSSLGRKVVSMSFGDKPIIKRFPGGFEAKKSGGKIIIIKDASFIANKLANLYNLYKLSFFAKNESPMTGLAVISNNYFRS